MTDILYFRPGTCALAPQTVVHWCGLDTKQINAPRDDSFLDINPTNAVPVLVFSDGYILTQLDAIMHALASASGSHDLLGKGERSKLEVARWSAFFGGDFHPAFYPVFMPQRYTTDTTESAIKNVEAAGMLLVEKFMKIIEAHLSTRNVFIGDGLTVVDAIAVPMLRWAKYKLEGGLTSYPSTLKFYERICKDEGVKAAMSVQGISP